jgi:hypothetical protein
MEDLLHGNRVELFPDRRLVLATAPLLRPPDGSTNCGIADAAIYQARPKVPHLFPNLMVSPTFQSGA